MGQRLLALIVLFATACLTAEEEPAPSADDLAALDAWATTADGKSDLPATWGELVDWLRDVYMNRMSAIWNNQEHPRTAADALTRIRGIATRAGKDATRLLYPMTIRRLVGIVSEVDHSEINIAMPDGSVIRLVGDPKGAGAFVDRSPFKSAVGPSLCLTWTELQTAIEASYLPGVYGKDFVCHTVTERVLRALDVGTSTYSRQYATYQAARWIWGPAVPSFNSQDPSDWAVSRRCQ